MKTDIFIRTYSKDIEWLKYCLRSIQKFGSGFSNIIICIPSLQVESLKPLNLTSEKVVTCHDYERDYLGQQVSKLYAWLHSDADLILYVDSDCVFTRPFSPESFMQDGKPIIYKTKYESIPEAKHWQGITEKFVGFKPEYEYMRRLPILHWGNSISHLVGTMEKTLGRFEERIFEQEGNSFSEFNLIGAFCEAYLSDKYIFIDTETVEMEPAYLKQYWSWSGLQPGMKADIERMLT